jgi:hypothetical protein
MELLETARSVHIAFGALVLAAFWSAAAARKGSALHRRMGRTFLLSTSALLAVTLVMAAGMASGGQGKRAMFNVYVTLISVTSVWMSWRSIEDRSDVDRYRGLACKLLCGLLGGYGLFVLSIAPRMEHPARVAMVAAFALLGLAVSASLLWRIVRGADHPRWWLSEHLTGMALNFAATHASFSILGLGLLVPQVKEPWTRTTILVSWMLGALIIRLWAGRRFLGKVDVAARSKHGATASRGIAGPV